MKENKYLEARGRSITKANDLIQRSRFDLSLQQQKVVLYLISHISPYDEDFKIYSFEIREFLKVIGAEIDSGANYSYLKKQIQDIADKSLWIKIENGKETLVRWIERPYIDENSGIIEIKLDALMKPYLLQLKNNYTTYELAYTLLFKSKYSLRLYEIAKSVHFHELTEYKRKYSVEELKIMMGAENNKEYRDFKRNALKKATDEINKYSDKDISFEEIKHGRKVIAIEFTIKTKCAVDRMKLREEIDIKLGPDQLTFWDI